MPKIAMYTGSFNPFHNGHLDIIRRASMIFDSVIVAVANNVGKRYTVSAEERATMIRAAIAARDDIWQDRIEVLVLPTNETAADFAINEEIDIIIRGIRNAADLEFENVMSAVNRDNGMETLYMPCSPEYSFISSSMIKECLQHNMSIATYVPISIYPFIKELYGKRE